MTSSVAIARIGEIDEGKGKAFEIGEKRIAIFHIDGQFHALMMLAHMLERHWPRVTLKMVKLGALGTMLNLN